jgi:autophagy-related protein 18
MPSLASSSGPLHGILAASFNQDQSCLAVATTLGFKIYSCDTGTVCYEDRLGAVRIVEMLFCTSLLCVVGNGEGEGGLSPRRLKVLNTSSHTCIADLTFISSILVG